MEPSPSHPEPFPPALPSPPLHPTLPELDLDTGRPVSAGEYKLADQTYAHLNDLIKTPAATKAPKPAATPQSTALAAPTLDPALAADILRFFVNPVPAPAPTQRKASPARNRSCRPDQARPGHP